MGVIATGSANARPFDQPPIDMSEQILALVSAKSKNPWKPIFVNLEPMQNPTTREKEKSNGGKKKTERKINYRK